MCVPFLEDINRANQRGGQNNSVSSVCCIYIKHALATFRETLYIQMKNECGHNDPALRMTTIQYILRKEHNANSSWKLQSGMLRGNVGFLFVCEEAYLSYLSTHAVK